MFKIGSYPSRAGMGSVLFAHYCSQKPWTQVELWRRSCWEGRELEEKAWSLSRKPGSLPFPWKGQILSYVHVHKCVLAQESFGQSLELSQFHQSGKQTKDKGL